MATQLKKTVKPSGGDYTSLYACLNANEQNLVTADKYFDIEIDGNWSSADTTVVGINNYTTDPTHYINIYTTTTARHKGVFSTSYYHLSRADDDYFCIYANPGNVTIDGIQATMVAPTTSNDLGFIRFPSANSGDKSYVKNSIFKATGTSNKYISGFRNTNDDDVNVTFVNNLIYDFATSEVLYSGVFVTQTGTFNIYNCTVVDCVKNIRHAGGTIVAKNVGASNMANADNGTPTLTTCSTSTPTFKDSANDDFHLASTDTTWHDAGTDLSADANYPFNTDIDGETRVTWDIGADEYVPSGVATGFMTTNKGYW